MQYHFVPPGDVVGIQKELAPLAQTCCLVFQNMDTGTGREPDSPGGVTVSAGGLVSRSGYPLVVGAQVHSGLQLSLMYDPRLFSRSESLAGGVAQGGLLALPGRMRASAMFAPWRAYGAGCVRWQPPWRTGAEARLSFFRLPAFGAGPERALCPGYGKAHALRSSFFVVWGFRLLPRFAAHFCACPVSAWLLSACCPNLRRPSAEASSWRRMDARAWSAAFVFRRIQGRTACPQRGACSRHGWAGTAYPGGALQRLPMRDEEAAHFARLFGGPYGQNEIFSE